MNLPALTAFRSDTTASPHLHHFQGQQDGAPFTLTLASPICVQLGHDLDTPHAWHVWVKDAPSRTAPGPLYAFTLDSTTPEGRAALAALR